MSYPKRPRFCRNCPADSRDGIVISYNGLCPTCGIDRMATALEEISERRGPNATKWAQAMAKSAQRIIDRNAREADNPPPAA